MAQNIFGLGLGGSGIVPVLVIVGVILIALNVNALLGQIAIGGGIVIGIIYGILGIFGILGRM